MTTVTAETNHGLHGWTRMGERPRTEDGGPAGSVSGLRSEASALRGLVVPCYDAASKRDMTETELRIVWLVLRCSFGNGRQETGRLTLADMALCLGVSKGRASEAVTKLRRKRALQASRSGDGWQFMPEGGRQLADGSWQAGHQWLVGDRLVDTSRRLMANRVERAQRRVAGEMSLPGMEEPNLDAVLGENAVAAAIGGGGVGRLEMGDVAERKPLSANCQLPSSPPRTGEGGRGTGGGGQKFLSGGVLKLGTSTLPSLFKSSPPLHREPLNTNHSLGSPFSNREPDATEGEAGMEIGGCVGEDPAARDEKTLMRRLVQLLGRETMNGKAGARLRLFIRGSLDAGDSTATAEAMRKAINDTETAVREGNIKKSRLGYLRGWAFYYAGRAGWRFDAATMKWMRCEPFSTWKQRNALRASIT